MSNFKVGDRVRVLNGDNGLAQMPVNSFQVVTSVRSSDVFGQILGFNHSISGWGAYRFELANPIDVSEITIEGVRYTLTRVENQ